MLGAISNHLSPVSFSFSSVLYLLFSYNQEDTSGSYLHHHPSSIPRDRTGDLVSHPMYEAVSKIFTAELGSQPFEVQAAQVDGHHLRCGVAVVLARRSTS